MPYATMFRCREEVGVSISNLPRKVADYLVCAQDLCLYKDLEHKRTYGRAEGAIGKTRPL